MEVGQLIETDQLFEEVRQRVIRATNTFRILKEAESHGLLRPNQIREMRKFEEELRALQNTLEQLVGLLRGTAEPHSVH